MFNKAGPVTVIIGEVKFAEPKFAKNDPNAFDVCVQCTHADDPAQSDWWRGEFSANYGKGNFQSMTQAQITMKTLHNVGFEGDDLSTLADQITGKRVPAMIKESAGKEDGKVFYNIQYIGSAGGGNAPKEEEVLSADALKARLKALTGGAAGSAPASAPAASAPATAPKPSPFGARTATGKPSPFGPKPAAAAEAGAGTPF